jgi:hypothetical protein
MAFKFYIDGQLVDQPVNDTALRTTIRRDQSVGGIVITQDADITWNGNNDLSTGEVSGYTLLKSAFDLGSCDELDVTIYDEISANQTILLYKGVIKVPSIQIDEHRVLASVKIQDNNFYSYINNNKSIEYNVQSLKTKNREDIVPPPIYEVDFFDSQTGVYGSTVGAYVRGYRVYDVFTFLTAALSDNLISFESDHLQQEPEIFIFDGFAMANPNTDPKVITSFQKLFDEIFKFRDIGFYIDLNNPDEPVLRIEQNKSLFTGLQVFSFDDLKEVVARIKADRIYAKIRVGASDNAGGAFPGTPYTFNAGTSYLGWADETYVPVGQCNFDNELNLVNDYGITSNDINDQVIGAVDSDLDKMFLVECALLDTVNLTASAVQYSSWVNTPYFYYNRETNNPNKLLIHNSNYQAAITNTLQVGSNAFRASLGSDLLIGSQDPSSPAFAFGFPGYSVVPVVFADETTGGNFDGNNNYNNTTGVYTAPLDGIYSFNARFNLDLVNFISCAASQAQLTITNPLTSIPVGSYTAEVNWGALVTITIAAYTDNTLTTLIDEVEVSNVFTLNGANFISASYTGYLNTGAVVGVITTVNICRFVFSPINLIGSAGSPYVLPNPNIELLNNQGWGITVQGCGVPAAARPQVYAVLDSDYACTGSPDGGGIVVENDPNIYKAKEFEFEYDISQTDWDTIKKNPTGLFAFEKDGITRYGWIDTMQRNDWTGMTNIKLITNNAITSQ